MGALSGICKALCLSLVVLLVACGGGGSGDSGGGFTDNADTLQISIRADSTTLPANLNDLDANPNLPYTTAVFVRVESRRDGSPAPTGTLVQLQVLGVEHGTLSSLDDPATPDNEITQRFGNISEEASSGVAQFFFRAGVIPGVATLVATVQDPISNRALSARLDITVTGIVRPAASLTFTGAFINAVQQRLTNVGDEEEVLLPDGNYQRLVSVVATDPSGNPINPATQINFFLIDGPITGYPQSGPGAFFIAGNDGDPLEGDFRFDATSGQFIAKGVRRFDRLVLDGRQTNQPLPDNTFLTGVRIIGQVLNQNTLFIQQQDPPFNAGPDNGPTVPYIIGRALHGTIISPSFTDLDGVAVTRLTYPVSRLGQTAVLVACISDFTVCTVLNTCDPAGANCGPVYLGVTVTGLDRLLTASDTSVAPNTSEQVTLCLKDPNFTPLPGETITYSIGPTGSAQVTIDGNSVRTGTLTVGGDGCVTVTIASSGLVPGILEDGIPIDFSSANVAAPVTVTIQPVEGILDCVATCTANAETSAGSCTINISLADQFGAPIAGARISVDVDRPATGAASVIFGQTSGSFGVTNDQGLLSATSVLLGAGSYTFTFSTVPGGALSCDIAFEIPEPPEEPGGGGEGDVLTIDTATLPNGTLGESYLALLEASGEAANSVLRWSISDGRLPPGLSLNAATGVISGTPTAQGTFSFILRVEDTAGGVEGASKLLSITITGDGGGGPSPGEPAALGLATDQSSVQSNNSDSATITATVLDDQNVGIPGITVTFSATGGQLSASQAVTDENGNATVEFRSGTVNSGNQVVTITATAGTLTRSIPIQIVGTGLTLETDTTSLPADGSQAAQITVTVRDAGGIPLFDRPVCFEEQSSGGGDLTLTDANGTALGQPCPVAGITGVLGGRTDVNGVLRIRALGRSAGQVNLIARAEGAQATQTFSINPLGEVFQIVEPPDNAPAQLLGTGAFNFVVSAPGATAVVFSTSLGTWQDSGDGSCQPPLNQAVVTCNVVNGQARARLTSTIAGTANVEARDRDQPNRTDNIQVQFTADICNAAKLQLEGLPRVVPVSGGGVQNVSNLTATLLTNQDQPVANAVVSFTLLESTGGGEFISPPTAVTDNTGEAKTTFVSGARSTSGQGITIQARVVRPETCPGELTATVDIVITEEAGSVTIGTSTTVASVNDNTAYSLPMSVLLADVNGNPVRGATVNLSAWPIQYSTGFRVTEPEVGVVITDTFPNEDINENTILDPGEDINGDTRLTPPNSAAGALPSTVTTDQNGVATFNLVYLKQYADWIVVRIRASALVSGTEVVSQIVFRLAGSVPDETADPPVLPNSPFNETCPYTASVEGTVTEPINIVRGESAQVTLVLNRKVQSADLGGRQVTAVEEPGRGISASDGSTNNEGRFNSVISVATNATAGISAVTFFASCAEPVSITVRIIDPLTANISPDGPTITAGGFIAFQAVVAGGIPDYGYNWNFGSVAPSSIDQNPSVQFTQPGVYDVTLVVTDDTGRTVRDSTRVTVNPPPPP